MFNGKSPCWDEGYGDLFSCDGTIWGVAAGGTSFGFGLFDTFGTASFEDLRDELKNIELMVQGIQNQVNELIYRENEAALQTQYSSAQRVIMEAVRCYNAYLNMTEAEDKVYWLREFRKYGSFVRESTNFVMDGMLGRGLLGSDIIKIVREMSYVAINIFIYLNLIIFIDQIVYYYRFISGQPIRLQRSN